MGSLKTGFAVGYADSLRTLFTRQPENEFKAA